MTTVAMLSLAASPAAAHKNHAKPAPAAAPGTPPADAADHTGHGMHVAPPVPAATPADPEPVEPPLPMPARAYDWLGRWHPALVHFPIALLIAAGALEIAARVSRGRALADAVRIMVALGAVSAVAAAALGWLAMGVNFQSDGPTHAAHRWLGTALAIAGVATWGLKEASVRRPDGARTALYGLALATAIAAIAVNGYLGGALVHGAGHLKF